MIGDLFLTKKEFDLFVKNLNIRLSSLTITEIGVEVPTYVPAHNDLGLIQGGAAGDYYHLTAARRTDLIDGGDCGIHKHDDRYYTEAEVDALLAALDFGIILDGGEASVLNGEVRLGLDGGSATSF